MEQNFDAPLNYKERIIKKGKVLKLSAPGFKGCKYFRILGVNRSTMVAKLLWIGDFTDPNESSNYKYSGFWNNISGETANHITTGSARDVPYIGDIIWTNRDGQRQYNGKAYKFDLEPDGATLGTYKEYTNAYNNISSYFKSALKGVGINNIKVYYVTSTSDAYNTKTCKTDEDYYTNNAQLSYITSAESSFSGLYLRPLSVDDLIDYFDTTDFKSEDINKKLFGNDVSSSVMTYQNTPNTALLGSSIFTTVPSSGGAYRVGLNTTGLNGQVYFGGASDYNCYVIEMDLQAIKNYFDIDTRFTPLN